MAEVNFIDGQQLTPSSFGQTNPTTGVWSPLAYTGTYGTNGFYLKFADNSGATATTIGKDSSGNSNNWTPSGISVTAGTTNDSLVDSPTNYGSDTGAGGEVRGNYATLTPLIPIPSGSLSSGNLQYSRGSTAAHGSAASSMTLPTSGKWYWEVTACASANNQDIGVANILNNPQLPAASSEIGGGSRGDYAYRSDGNKYNNGNQGAYGATYTNGDVIGVAWNSDSGTLTFYKNGVSQGTAFSSITQVDGKFAAASSSAETGSDIYNFGQRPFAYTAPSGFKALCTQNLTTPTIVNGGKYFNAITYTAATNSTVSGFGFKPDLIINKLRNTASSNWVTDSVRGSSKMLATDSSSAESTDATFVSGFTSDGFTTGSGFWNGYSSISWGWNAGSGSSSSNTSGTITSTVSANTTAGFSVVTFTMNGTTGATVGHGLGVAPQMIIIKRRDAVIGWVTYHVSVGNGSILLLNATDAAAAGNYWNSTSPTSSVFTLGTSASGANVLNSTAVAYCFAAIPGFSAFGSYTGNGAADGVFVWLGFRPRWLMIKRTDTTSDWWMYDTSRDTYNQTNALLYADLSSVENTSGTNHQDILSNGFKLRDSGAGDNVSGGTYIYAAFAENPFKYSRAR